MPATRNQADIARAYRRRLVEAGRHQVVVALPKELIALIDDLQVRHGLPNRSQAIERLIDQWRQTADSQMG